MSSRVRWQVGFALTRVSSTFSGFLFSSQGIMARGGARATCMGATGTVYRENSSALRGVVRNPSLSIRGAYHALFGNNQGRQIMVALRIACVVVAQSRRVTARRKREQLSCSDLVRDFELNWGALSG